MAEIGGYRELEAWHVAMDLVIEGYALSTRFPPNERFGLTSQLRNALVSVPSNIAEGHARRAPKAMLYHLAIALGSLAEVDTQMEVAIRLHYVPAAEIERFHGLVESSRRLMHGLRRAKQRELAMTVVAPIVVLVMLTRVVWDFF